MISRAILELPPSKVKRLIILEDNEHFLKLLRVSFLCLGYCMLSIPIDSWREQWLLDPSPCSYLQFVGVAVPVFNQHIIHAIALSPTYKARFDLDLICSRWRNSIPE